MSISLSVPGGEPPNHYLNLTGPLLDRYGSGPLDVVVDLGAHVGAFSVLAAKEFGAKLVFAVEADPVNFSHLIVNIGENRVANRVIPIMGCIAVESYKPKKLYYAGSSGQQGIAFDPTRFPFIEVLSLGLKDLFRLIPKKVDFMKIDIEGSEWELFDKPEKVWNIMKKVNYLDIELHPTSDPKYHAERKEGQVEEILKMFELMGFNLSSGGERWDYYGFKK